MKTDFGFCPDCYEPHKYCKCEKLKPKAMKATIKNQTFWLEPEHKRLFEKPFTPIDIREYKKDIDSEWGTVRVYCTQHPNQFNLQIRALQSLDDMGKQKKRNIIATVSISRKEILALADYIKNYGSL